MSVLIAIGFDEAPVVVAAYDVGLQAWHDSYIQLVCVVVKGCRPRRRGRHMRVIRIYRWRCTDRAIEPLARHDVRCAKGPSLLAISLIYSGICGQGKNADTPFATVNPEGQARTHRKSFSKRRL